MKALIEKYIVKGKQNINKIKFEQDKKKNKTQQKQERVIPEQWEMKYSHNTLC